MRSLRWTIYFSIYLKSESCVLRKPYVFVELLNTFFVTICHFQEPVRHRCGILICEGRSGLPQSAWCSFFWCIFVDNSGTRGRLHSACSNLHRCEPPQPRTPAILTLSPAVVRSMSNIRVRVKFWPKCRHVYWPCSSTLVQKWQIFRLYKN